MAEYKLPTLSEIEGFFPENLIVELTGLIQQHGEPVVVSSFINALIDVPGSVSVSRVVRRAVSAISKAQGSDHLKQEIVAILGGLSLG